MKIAVNGDSYTHERHLAQNESYIEKTWAYKIGAENLAMGGSSNDRIFYTTIEYLTKNDPDVLIIGWTNHERVMLTHHDGLNLHVGPNGVANDLLQRHSYEGEDDLLEYRNFYYKKMFNSFLNFKRFLTYYSHLEKYCRTNSIRFLNWTVWPLPNDNELEKIATEAYMSKTDKEVIEQGIKFNHNILKKEIATFKKENWINQEIGYSIETHLGHMPRWHDGHLGLEASNLWAEIIKSNLT